MTRPMLPMREWLANRECGRAVIADWCAQPPPPIAREVDAARRESVRRAIGSSGAYERTADLPVTGTTLRDLLASRGGPAYDPSTEGAPPAPRVTAPSDADEDAIDESDLEPADWQTAAAGGDR